MAADWHYAEGDRPVGPLPESEVAKRIQADPRRRHIVWRSGFADWADAKSVPEFASLCIVAPPPLPPGRREPALWRKAEKVGNMPSPSPAGAPIAPQPQIQTVVIYKTKSNAGVFTGLFGSVFAILGLFFFALLFLPFAILLTIISFLRSITSLNALGTFMALMSGVLTVICLITSPTAILAFLAIVGLASSR